MKSSSPCRIIGIVLLAVLSFAMARAQSKPAAPATPAKGVKPSSDEVVELNPFEVQADPDNSYGALNSNSITRFNTELANLPVSGDIFTQTFMNDIAATSVESIVVGYSAGAGMSNPDPGVSALAQPGDNIDHEYIQLRGFNTPVIMRDSLMPIGPVFNPGSTAPGFTSNFDLDRVEVINGPQSLLYSYGGPGGVINALSKQARLGQHPFGSLRLSVDQYGSKQAQFDYGMGTDKVALRIAVLNAVQDTRRVFIGRQVQGYYFQFAFRPFARTTIRLTGQQTNEHSINSGVFNLATGNSDTDSRDGIPLTYLLATNQAGANTRNASGAPDQSGAILGGKLNWSNVSSLAGWLPTEKTDNRYESLLVQTEWTKSISSELALGYSNSDYDFRSSANFYAPQNSTNTTGGWAIGSIPSDNDQPARTKAIRFSMMAKQNFFGGKGESLTVAGADFVRSDAALVKYDYFLADANFQAVVNPAIATNNGRTIIPRQFFSIANGPARYPFLKLATGSVTVNGVNYVRQMSSNVDRNLISPTNQVGLSSTAIRQITKLFTKGIFAANNTEWLDGRLNTIAGMRLSQTFDENLVFSPPPVRLVTANSASFNVGVNYALRSWLRVYVGVSDSYAQPQIISSDPVGNFPKAGRALGKEVGLKFTNAESTLSGSVAFYRTDAKDDESDVGSTIQAAINPNGLNGRGTTGTVVDLDRTSQGVQVTLTANPTKQWRLRLSAADVDGTIHNTKKYGQLYNDQFYADASGQVTYADHTPVFVNPAFNSKQPVVPAGTAGALPLTIQLMNTRTSPYFANPVNPTGAIRSTSAVATVLKSVDPVHGAILTGATGLPISAIQITPSFALPNIITAASSGDKTAGYPQFSMNLTSSYGFTDGLLRGFQVGGTFASQGKSRQYYYYPGGFPATLTRELFYAPSQTRVDLMVGYSKSFRRIKWSSQLNVGNLFNHYVVVVLPDEVTGWTNTGNLNAAFHGQPRSYLWTNTFSF